MSEKFVNHTEDGQLAVPVRWDDKLAAWIVAGLPEAKQVLRMDDCFSTQIYSEFGPDISRAHDVLNLLRASDTSHRRLKQIFTKGISTRLSIIESSVLRPIAKRLAEHLPVKAEIDVIEQYVRPYFRAAVYGIVGISSDYGDEIIATMKVTESYFRNEGPASPEGHASLGILNERAREIFATTRKQEGIGLIQFVDKLRFDPEITEDELVCLTLPLFKTLAFDVRRDLTAHLIKHIAYSGKLTQQKLLRQPGSLVKAAKEAVRLEEGRFIPRITIKDVTVGEVKIPKGARVLVMLGDVGKDCRIFADPYRFDPWRKHADQHVGFGAGLHRCIGESIAIAIATNGAGSLLNRFELVGSDSKTEGKLFISLHLR